MQDPHATMANINEIVRPHPESYRYYLAAALSYLMQCRDAEDLILAQKAIDKIIVILQNDAGGNTTADERERKAGIGVENY